VNIGRITLAVFGGLVATGCAFVNVPVELPTAPLGLGLEGGHGREVTVVAPFQDERTIRDRCGMQKNGYNMDTADAVCQSDPAEWIAILLTAELRSAGFRVVEGSSEAAAVRIEGALLKLFVEPVIGAWTGSLEADLSARLTVTSGSGLEAERLFFEKTWRGGQVLSHSGAYQIALERAARGIVGDMVAAIAELLDRYPQLGIGPGERTVQ